MKIKLLILLLVISVSACKKEEVSESPEQAPSAQAEPADSHTGAKRYQLESGKIEYKLSGGQSGTETLTFDRFGLREAKLVKSVIEFQGVKQNNHSISIFRDGKIITIDLNSNTGVEVTHPFAEMFNSEERVDLGEELLRQMGGEKIGNDVVLGRPCQMWEIKQANTKTCLWKMIPLKAEATFQNFTLHSVAVKIDESANVEESVFEIPKNVTIADTVGAPSLVESKE